MPHQKRKLDPVQNSLGLQLLVVKQHRLKMEKTPRISALFLLGTLTFSGLLSLARSEDNYAAMVKVGEFKTRFHGVKGTVYIKERNTYTLLKI